MRGVAPGVGALGAVLGTMGVVMVTILVKVEEGGGGGGSGNGGSLKDVYGKNFFKTKEEAKKKI
jgi:preprotein translocase subunit SecG